MTTGANDPADCMHSRYVELPPPAALAERVVCFWTETISDGPGDYAHGVLPDGCVDLIWVGEAPPVVAGPATRRIVVHLPARARLVGVRLLPGSAAATLGHPAHALSNQDVPLDDLWPAAARLTEQVFDRRSLNDQLARLGTALGDRFAAARAPDHVIRVAVGWLANHPAGRVRDLAQWIGLSERQLERRFRDEVGYGPKIFQRIMRLQRLLAVAAAPGVGGRSLAALAHDAGYADQAHMCRDVRALADQSPQALLAGGGGTLAMSDLFNTDASGDASFEAIDQPQLQEPSWNNASA